MAAVLLTLATAFGYGYFIGHAVAFRNCDGVTHTEHTYELFLDLFNYFSTVIFVLTVLFYIIQRRLFKHRKDLFHEITRRLLETSLVLATVYIISKKALDSYMSICQIFVERYNSSFCFTKYLGQYECTYKDLRPSQKLWYNAYSLLEPIILILNQELYPVLFTLHYMASRTVYKEDAVEKEARKLASELCKKQISKRMIHSRTSQISLIVTSVTLLFSQTELLTTFVKLINLDVSMVNHDCALEDHLFDFAASFLKLSTFVVAYYSLWKVLAGKL